MLKQGNNNIWRITCDYCGDVLEEAKEKSKLHDESYYNKRLWGEEDGWECPSKKGLDIANEDIAFLEKRSRNFHFCCKSHRNSYFRKVWQAWYNIDTNPNVLRTSKMPLRAWANTRHAWDIPACKWESYAYLRQPKEQIQYYQPIEPRKVKKEFVGPPPRRYDWQRKCYF